MQLQRKLVRNETTALKKSDNDISCSGELHDHTGFGGVNNSWSSEGVTHIVDGNSSISCGRSTYTSPIPNHIGYGDRGVFTSMNSKVINKPTIVINNPIITTTLLLRIRMSIKMRRLLETQSATNSGMEHLLAAPASANAEMEQQKWGRMLLQPHLQCHHHHLLQPLRIFHMSHTFNRHLLIKHLKRTFKNRQRKEVDVLVVFPVNS